MQRQETLIRYALTACFAALAVGGCGGGGGAPTISPAADKVVFQSNRDGQFEIYAMNGDGTAQTRLTNNANIDQDPAWSPNAAQVAYAARTSVASTSLEITTIAADGTQSRQLTTNAFLDDKPSWSPDGSQIVFRSTRPDVSGGVPFSNSDIYIINSDGSNERRLTSTVGIEREPSFTPDGRIVFTQEKPGLISGIFRIARIDADGSNLTALTDGPDDARPAMSSDGRRIAFTARRGGNTDVFVMNANGTGITRITNTADVERSPAFSPDGRRIVFATVAGGNGDIFVMNANGSSPVRLTTNSAVDTVPDVR